MLLYFGYTRCPDECPTTMADIAIALRSVPPAIRAETRVVFVSSDPQHDSPSVLAAWLHHFDKGLPTPFVGLTGELKQTYDVARSVGVPIKAPVTHKDGTVTVDHGTQFLAFVNGTAKLAWIGDTDPDAFASDLERLAEQVS